MKLLLCLVLTAAVAGAGEADAPEDRARSIIRLRHAIAPLKTGDLVDFCAAGRPAVSNLFARFIPPLKTGDPAGVEGLERMRASMVSIKEACGRLEEPAPRLHGQLSETVAFLEALTLRDARTLAAASPAPRLVPEMRAAPSPALGAAARAAGSGSVFDGATAASGAAQRWVQDVMGAPSPGTRRTVLGRAGAPAIIESSDSGTSLLSARFEPIWSGVGDSWVGENQKQQGLSVYAQRRGEDGTWEAPEPVIQYLDGASFEIPEAALGGTLPSWVRISTSVAAPMAQRARGVVRGRISQDGSYDLRSNYDLAAQSPLGRLASGTYGLVEGAGGWAVGLAAMAAGQNLRDNPLYLGFMLLVDKTFFEGNVKAEDLREDMFQRNTANFFEANGKIIRAATGMTGEEYDAWASRCGIDLDKSLARVRAEVGQNTYGGAVLGAWVKYANLAPAFAIMGAMSTVANWGGPWAEAVEAAGTLMAAHGAGNTLRSASQLDEAKSTLEETWKRFELSRGTPAEAEARAALGLARDAYFDAVEALSGEALGLVQNFAEAEFARRLNARRLAGLSREAVRERVLERRVLRESLSPVLKKGFSAEHDHALSTYATDLYPRLYEADARLFTARNKLVEAENALLAASDSGKSIQAPLTGLRRAQDAFNAAESGSAREKAGARSALHFAERRAGRLTPSQAALEVQGRLMASGKGRVIEGLSGRVGRGQAERFVDELIAGLFSGDSRDLKGLAADDAGRLELIAKLKSGRLELRRRLIDRLKPASDLPPAAGAELARHQALMGAARALPRWDADAFYRQLEGRALEQAPGRIIDPLAPTAGSPRHGQEMSPTCAAHAAACIGDAVGARMDMENIFLAGSGASEDLILGKGAYADTKVREAEARKFLEKYDREGPHVEVTRRVLEEAARQIEAQRGLRMNPAKLNLEDVVAYMAETGLPVYYSLSADYRVNHAVILKDPVVVRVTRRAEVGPEDLVRFTLIDSNHKGRLSYIYMDEAARAQNAVWALKPETPPAGERLSMLDDAKEAWGALWGRPIKGAATAAREAASLGAMKAAAAGGSARFKKALAELYRDYIHSLHDRTDAEILGAFQTALESTPVRYMDPSEKELAKTLKHGAAVYLSGRREGQVFHEIIFNPALLPVPPAELAASLIHELTHRLGGGEMAAHRAEVLFALHEGPAAPLESSEPKVAIYRRHQAVLKEAYHGGKLERHVLKVYAAHEETMLDLPHDRFEVLVHLLHDSDAKLSVLKKIQAERRENRGVDPAWIKRELSREFPGGGAQACVEGWLGGLAEAKLRDINGEIKKLEGSIADLESGLAALISAPATP